MFKLQKLFGSLTKLEEGVIYNTYQHVLRKSSIKFHLPFKKQFSVDANTSSYQHFYLHFALYTKRNKDIAYSIGIEETQES